MGLWGSTQDRVGLQHGHPDGWVGERPGPGTSLHGVPVGLCPEEVPGLVSLGRQDTAGGSVVHLGWLPVGRAVCTHLQNTSWLEKPLGMGGGLREGLCVEGQW